MKLKMGVMPYLVSLVLIVNIVNMGFGQLIAANPLQDDYDKGYFNYECCNCHYHYIVDAHVFNDDVLLAAAKEAAKEALRAMIHQNFFTQFESLDESYDISLRMVCFYCNRNLTFSRSSFCFFPSGGGYCIFILVLESWHCACQAVTSTRELPGCGAWHQ